MIYVMPSGKTLLMEEQTVLSKISLFHIFIFIDCFQIVQETSKLFSEDVHV